MTDFPLSPEAEFIAKHNGINFLLGNLEEDIKDIIFDGETVCCLPWDTDIFSILMSCGIFPSKSQARKNWHGTQTIPEGFTKIVAGKRKVAIFIHREVRQ